MTTLLKIQPVPTQPDPTHGGGIVPPWLDTPWHILPWPRVDTVETGRTDTVFISGSLKVGTRHLTDE